MRILRLLAQHRRRELADHDADRSGQTRSEPRRRRLQRAVTKSGVQVTQAQARRSHRPARDPVA